MSVQTNQSRKQELKKYIIFVLMFLVFGTSMWFIFGPSEKDKLEQEAKSGYNDKIPDPSNGVIVEDKRTAYEQDLVKKNKDEKMRSLQDYSSFLDELSKEKKEAKEIDLMGDLAPDTSSRQSPQPTGRPSAIQSSVSSYRDINRTLGSFYEEPLDDPEKEELKMKLEQLEARVTDKEKEKSLMNEQLTLMEKSYQMAAKYMPQGQNQESQLLENAGKNQQVSLVRQVQNPIVSALFQPLSNEEFVNQYGKERNLDFLTACSQKGGIEKNTIDAVTDCEQVVVSGQSIRLRLTEPIFAGTNLIPENTVITGMAKIQGERLYIDISVIEHKGMVIPVDLSVLDADGQTGIFIPGSMEIQAVKEIIANAGSAVGTSFTLTQDAGEQIVSDLTKGLIQGSSQYMRKKLNQVKVTIKPGYKLLLIPNQKS